MCPEWESNWWPFSSQAGAQSTELHQLELKIYIVLFLCDFISPKGLQASFITIGYFCTSLTWLPVLLLPVTYIYIFFRGLSYVCLFGPLELLCLKAQRGQEFFFFLNSFLKKDFIYLFLERGEEGRKKGRETMTWERNIDLACTPVWDQAHNTGMCPDQECALTGNWTSDLLLCRRTPNQLSHTGWSLFLNWQVLEYEYSVPVLWVGTNLEI